MEHAAEALRERQAWLSGQRDALEEALDGAPLERSLGVLVRTATEALGPGTRAAFYLANEEGTELHHVVGMPADYADAVGGFVIGPESVACGLATHRGEPVLTGDVLADPRWEPWRWLAARYEYRSCWSFPIHTATGKHIGTFSVYSRTPREPTQRELDLASLLTGTAAIIISRHMESEARERAEAALRQSEDRLRLITDSLPVLISYIDAEHRYRFTSKTYEHWFGAPRDAIEGKHVREVLGERNYELVRPRLEQTLGGETVAFETRARYPRKGLRDVSAVYVPHVRESGETVGLYALVTDITERKRAEDVLRESEERQRFLLELSDALRPLTDPVEIQVTAARVLREQLGISRAMYCEIIDETWVDVRSDHVDGAASVTERRRVEDFGAALVDSFRNGEPLVIDDVETDPRFSDAERRALVGLGARANLSVGLVKGGRWVAALGAHQTSPRTWTETDLYLVQETAERTWAAVERASAEAALRASEGKYRTLFDSIDEGFCVIRVLFDDQGRPTDFVFEEVNPAFERQAGIDNPTGRSMREIAPEHEEHWFEIYGRIAATGRPERFERFASALDRWYDVYAFRIDEPHARRVAVLFTDISQRKQAEADLRASEDRLRRAMTVDTIGVLYFRLDGSILDANPALERMTGYTLAELRELSDWAVLTPPEFWAVTARTAASLAESGRTPPYEKQLIRKDGSRFWGLFAPTRLSGSGRDSECVEFIIDITDRKRAAQALLDSDRRKSEFLATLAHELRNPLAPILNSAQLLTHIRDPDPLVTRARDIIRRQATHMVRLVDDLLDVSRISRGKLELKKQRAELAPILHHALELAHPLCAAKDQRVDVELPSEPIWLDADTARITQVFGNLLNNASRYSARGSRITIHASRAGGPGSDAVVRVRDTGIGIPPDQVESIFELFEQVDRSLERETGGLGVGLSLVRSLVEMHGGTVEAHSDGPGTGSEFVVRLPALVDERRARAPEPAETEAAATVPRRILVVDDNRDAAQTLAALLELMGHEVATAHDGAEAVARAEAFRAEVVLLDIGMPHVNGYEAARSIRERQGPDRPRLIALTGWGQEEDRRRSHAAGFDAHLVKPVNLALLTELLAAWDD